MGIYCDALEHCKSALYIMQWWTGCIHGQEEKNTRFPRWNTIFPRCILHFRLYLVWSSKTYQFCKSTICYTPAFNFPVLKCTYNAGVFFSWYADIGNGATIDRMRERPILGQVQTARENVVFSLLFHRFQFFHDDTDDVIYEKVVYYLLWFVKYFVVLYE